jgi:hypothetical protein
MPGIVTFRPRRWPQWSLQIHSVAYPRERLAPGTFGVVHGPAGAMAPVAPALAQHNAKDQTLGEHRPISADLSTAAHLDSAEEDARVAAS